MIVKLKNAKNNEDNFFICTKAQLQDATYKDYKTFLDKRGGLRRRKPESEMNATAFSFLMAYKDN